MMGSMSQRFDGHVVVVTGSATGIGEATSNQPASRVGSSPWPGTGSVPALIRTL